MIYEVIIHLGCKNYDFESQYTDEQEAIDTINLVLDRFKLNNGCTMMSIEDTIAVNATIAELTDDLMNDDNWVQFEEVRDKIVDALDDYIRRHGCSELDDDDLLNVANLFGVY